MNIKAAADQCKGEIHSAVAAAVQRFREQTGVTPSDIDIRMVESTAIGDDARQFLVGDVRLGFTL